MSTHKHSEAGNELRSLSMIRYDQSMNATTQRSKDSHFWHLTPLPAHRQVHTSHTPTSGLHNARQMTDTSRWWTMRWPSNAVSLLGRAGNLSTGQTYDLLKKLWRVSVEFSEQLLDDMFVKNELILAPLAELVLSVLGAWEQGRRIRIAGTHTTTGADTLTQTLCGLTQEWK